MYDIFKNSFCADNIHTYLILGHGGGRQEGGRKWAGRGGIGFFLQGGAFFATGGGKNTVKLRKKALKQALFKEV